MPDEALLHRLLNLKSELERTIDELSAADDLCRTVYTNILDTQPLLDTDLNALDAALIDAQTRLRGTRRIFAAFRKLQSPGS